MKKIKFPLTAMGAALCFTATTIAFNDNQFISSNANASSSTITILNAGFEDGKFTGWVKGSQTTNLGDTITGSGTGVSIFSGSRTFIHGAQSAMGDPTLSNGNPNPYYAPPVAAGSWTFSPKNATYGALLQPKNEQTFTQAIDALGLSNAQLSEITTMLTTQASASGFGFGNPTDAAWITREVELTAGITYTMSWNYVGTDYVPFNDGSITSLVAVSTSSTPVIKVNNFTQSYAALGFTNPGTGDYSTNSFGSTGWQTSTYNVDVTGTYKLGFAVFNLDDIALSPVLMIDSEVGTTEQCDQTGTCTAFGGVAPNNDTAPTLPPPTTQPEPTPTTQPEPTTTTQPEPTTTELPSTTISLPIETVVTAPDLINETPSTTVVEVIPESTKQNGINNDKKELPKTGISINYILNIVFILLFLGIIINQRKKYLN